jgi:hypothetical protein
VLKLIRRIFANLAKASELKDAGKVPYVRTPEYMDMVEENLSI